jgi:hypothetical protein
MLTIIALLFPWENWIISKSTIPRFWDPSEYNHVRRLCLPNGPFHQFLTKTLRIFFVSYLRVTSHAYLIVLDMIILVFSLALESSWALATDSFLLFHDYFTDGRTSWTSDQLVAMVLPKHRATQIQNKYMYIPNIHTLCGIRTHDPGFRASEESTRTCLRPRGYRHRRLS